MRLKIRLLFLCSYILTGCSNTNIQDLSYILNDSLLSSYQEIDDSLKYKRGQLLFNGEREANDCNSYYEMASKYRLEESIHNQLVKSEYLICDALKILSSSLGISTENIKILGMGGELLSRLDLRSFPSSLNRASNETSHTLKSLYPSKVSHTDNIAELQTEDWGFTMEVVALARINSNPYPDWIIWVSDESKSGNYRGYSTIILYDPEEQETFRATTFP